MSSCIRSLFVALASSLNLVRCSWFCCVFVEHSFFGWHCFCYICIFWNCVVFGLKIRTNFPKNHCRQPKKTVRIFNHNSMRTAAVCIPPPDFFVNFFTCSYVWLAERELLLRSYKYPKENMVLLYEL